MSVVLGLWDMRPSTVVTAVAVALLAVSSAQAGTYACMKDGKRVYSDRPCVVAPKRETKDIIAEVQAKSKAMHDKEVAENERLLQATIAKQKAREEAARLAAIEKAKNPKAAETSAKPEAPTAIAMSPVNIAHIAGGFTHAASVKMQVAEYYAMNGTLPKDNKQLGIPPPQEWSVKALKSLEVRDGTINLVYDKQSGIDNGVIRLVPDVSRPHIGVEWDCVTPSFPAIQTYLSVCAYQKGG